MKRFHVHVTVDDLDKSIRFYTTLFGAEPAVRKPDYAKWMVEDPRLNFAISTRGREPGLNHLGFQLDSDEEFKSMHDQLAAADAGLVEEIGANCCYAKSDKYWVTDPAGIAWETYHTLGSIPVFGESTAEATNADNVASSACCGTAPVKIDATIPVKSRGCCA